MTNRNAMEDDDFEDGLDLVVPGAKERTRVLFRIGEELQKESDRGCALVAAAYLENQISELLEGFFVEQGKNSKEALFDFNGPVGTFSAKIKMSYALGLIPREIEVALDLVRNLRNKFAHLHEPLDFESPSIKQRVVSLLPSLEVQHHSMRQTFIRKIQSMAATIHLCISHVYRQKSPEYEQVPLREDPNEQEIEIAARRMMKITAPELTYAQAIDMARKLREIK